MNVDKNQIHPKTGFEEPTAATPHVASSETSRSAKTPEKGNQRQVENSERDAVSTRPIGVLPRQQTPPSELPTRRLSSQLSVAQMMGVKRPSSPNTDQVIDEKRVRIASPQQLTYHDLSEKRPNAKKIDNYNMHQHAYIGNKGHPEQKPAKEKDLVTGKWKKTGEMSPAAPAMWTEKDSFNDLSASTSIINFSSLEKRAMLKWEEDILTVHIKKHSQKQWFIDMFGTGLEGVNKYQEESKNFASISASESIVRRFALLCESQIKKVREDLKFSGIMGEKYQASFEAELSKLTPKDIMLYSYRDNMLLVLHKDTGSIHTFFSPRDAEKYVRDTLKVRTSEGFRK